MWILIALIFAIALFYFLGKQPVYLLPRGKHLSAKQLEIEGISFYVEEVRFPDYHQAIHHYYHLIPIFSDRNDVLETHYNYLDWTNTILRFPDSTMQLVRRIDKILLIKSQMPLSVAEFERLVEGI